MGNILDYACFDVRFDVLHGNVLKETSWKRMESLNGLSCVYEVTTGGNEVDTGNRTIVLWCRHLTFEHKSVLARKKLLWDWRIKLGPISIPPFSMKMRGQWWKSCLFAFGNICRSPMALRMKSLTGWIWDWVEQLFLGTRQPTTKGTQKIFVTTVFLWFIKTSQQIYDDWIFWLSLENGRIRILTWMCPQNATQDRSVRFWKCSRSMVYRWINELMIELLAAKHGYV